MSGGPVDSRVYLRRKPRRCPVCGFSPVASILYGLPAFICDPGYLKAGQFVLGGCGFTFGEDPFWFCTKCRTYFHRMEDMSE